MTIGPEAEITLVGRGTDDDGWERDEWDVTLSYLDREMQTKFYTGTAHGKPTVSDVVQSLFSDAEGVEYETFEGWAESYGYDTDSRKALAMYEGVVEQTERVKELFGDDFDFMRNTVAELYA